MTLSYRWLGLVCLALWLAVPGSAQQNSIEVKVVSYKQLGETVTQFKGKVVVVDFWGLTCVPCVKEFPHRTLWAGVGPPLTQHPSPRFPIRGRRCSEYHAAI